MSSITPFITGAGNLAYNVGYVRKFGVFNGTEVHGLRVEAWENGKTIPLPRAYFTSRDSATIDSAIKALREALDSDANIWRGWITHE